MRPINYFMIPIGTLTVLAGYFAFQVGSPYTWALLVGTVLLAICYTLSPQINWWYWQRYPPDLPAGLRRLLTMRFPFYNQLPPADQREFRRRVFLFQEAKDFRGQGIENLPDDMKTLAAISAVRIGFGREDFLFEPFDTVVFYPHPFPSPQFDFLHTSELYVPDGTLIFSIDHFARSVLDEQAFLSLGLYEYSRIYRHRFPQQEQAVLEWPDIEAISGFSQEAIETFVGLKEGAGLDRAGVTAALFFSFPEKFALKAPEVFRALRSYYQFPVNSRITSDE